MIYSIQNKIIDTILFFLMIISTGGMYFVLNRNIMSICFFSLLVFTIIFFGNQIKKKIFYASVLTFLCIFTLGAINFFFAISEQSINKYGFHFLSLIIGILFIVHFQNNRSEKIFLDRFYLVLKIIALHAAVNFILYFFIQNNLSDVISRDKDVYKTFFHIFYYMPEKSVVSIFNFEFCRNQGLFWEPGILQIYLNMLFFLEAFVFKKSKLLLLLASVLIITTYSTTGLILLLFQSFFYFKSSFKNKKVLAPILIILLIPIYLVLSTNVKEKISGEREASFQKRMFDFTQPFFIALDYPLTGIGLDLVQFQKKRQEFYISSNRLQSINSSLGVQAKFETTEKGSSNSIMFLLACTGFPTTIILLFMFYKQKIIRPKKYIWSILLTLSVISEPLLLRPFFLIFIISGFVNIFTKINNQKVVL